MSLDAVDLEVLRLVEAACRTVGVPWMLVGALARDVHLVEIAGVPSGRATIDVDVAVAVESWAAFNELKNVLTDSGNFTPGRNAYRVLGTGEGLLGRQLDIMPFGRGIEEPRAATTPAGRGTILKKSTSVAIAVAAIHVARDPQIPDNLSEQLGFDFDVTPGELAYTDAERAAAEREDARFYLERMRDSIERAGAKPHNMRSPCPDCGCTLGVVTVKSSQNSVRCAKCDRYSYNAPKVETGQVARSLRTIRTGIKPSQQSRILDRDHGRCVLCGSVDDLTIGHLLSVADGFALGALESELNDDANLAAMCEGCNAGLGPRSVSTRTYLVVSRARRSMGSVPV